MINRSIYPQLAAAVGGAVLIEGAGCGAAFHRVAVGFDDEKRVTFRTFQQGAAVFVRDGDRRRAVGRAGALVGHETVERSAHHHHTAVAASKIHISAHVVQPRVVGRVWVDAEIGKPDGDIATRLASAGRRKQRGRNQKWQDAFHSPKLQGLWGKSL